MKNVAKWVEVVSFDGLYSVSCQGQVRRNDSTIRSGSSEKMKRSGRILKPTTTKRGYRIVTLHREGVATYATIHRLVALHFCDNFEYKPEVNHINGDKLDNKAVNLEWCTRNENLRHAHRTGLLNQWGEKNPAAKLSDQDVIDVRKKKVEGMMVKDIAKEYSVSPSLISMVCRGGYRD